MTTTTRRFAAIHIRVPTFYQQRQRERDLVAAADPAKPSSAENDTTYRAARGELIQLIAAVQRLLSNYGYDLNGADFVIEGHIEEA